MSQFETHNPSKAKPGKLYELVIQKWHFERPSFTTFDIKGETTGQKWLYEHPVVCMVLEQNEGYTTVLNGENVMRVGYTEFDRAIEGYDTLLISVDAVADKHTK